ncbi:MAG: cob(I)yrinic acid a,c-diamide adenosyltransferase [Defluviitaleaceae bacterium]|nr:cob(I)yrinic acid a,c-diamide adenosyltransferase [Defluviitaleaceae bacterium]
MSKVTVITGNGKGKTTSALGLAMQAAAAGKRVYLGQFMKQGDYSEIAMLKSAFPEIFIEQYSGAMVINREVRDDDKAHAQEGMAQAAAAVSSNDYDLIVLDEINIVLFLEFVTLQQVKNLIESRGSADLVLTGRYAAPEIIEMADDAYEMQEVKHYFAEGVGARKGIEM